MHILIILGVVLVAQAAGDIESLSVELLSDDFKKRENAERSLTAWVQQDDSIKRAETLFERYLVSEDPEESRRLVNILLDVHLEQKRSSIPQTGPGFMGITMSPEEPLGLRKGPLPQIKELKSGVFVSDVIAGTPADKAGLIVGDLIVQVDGVELAGESPTKKLQETVRGKLPGTKIGLSVRRGDEHLLVDIILMNGGAVIALPWTGEARVSIEKAEQLLEEDYLRWLNLRKSMKRASGPENLEES